MKGSGIRLGVDASNMRSGGTMTHVAELLAHADPEKHGISRVILWASETLMERVSPRPWLERVHIPALNRTLPRRVLWQMFERSRLAEESCDIVFAPGAAPAGTFRPYVSMSVNLLPFSRREWARYGWSRDFLRLALLRAQQAHAYRQSNAVIFLSQYARASVSSIVRPSAQVRVAVIPSGVNDRFRCRPRTARPLASYTETEPFRFLYVSDIHPYKHQWNVVDAVAALKAKGLPVALDIVGFPVHRRSNQRLDMALSRLEAADHVRFLGPLAHDALPVLYRDAGAFIFASTCENLPMALVEAMASGLPIAASETRPMPDILGRAHVAFDAQNVASIEAALHSVAVNHDLRGAIAERAYAAAGDYLWVECADRTFSLLAEVATAAAVATGRQKAPSPSESLRIERV